MFETIDAPLDRDNSFILASREDKYIRQLLKRILNLRHTLIDIPQLSTHAEVRTNAGHDETHRS